MQGLSFLTVLFLLICGGSILVFGAALAYKIFCVNKEELSEIHRFQGSFSNLWKGQLREMPNQLGDFRIVRGLRWDPKKKRYISQSGLSSEGLRAAFPK